MRQPTRLDYCQYLLSSPLNDTLTHFADHSEGFSHDMINRYLAGDRIPPRLVWEHVKDHIALTPEGYVIFDDTVLVRQATRAQDRVSASSIERQRPRRHQRHRGGHMCLCPSATGSVLAD